ncbi:restriction endonuclease, partial [Planococcus sp. SIMBA_143]
LDYTFTNGAYFVTTSTFTNKAIEAANKHGIILIDGNKLVEIILELSKGLKEVKGLSFLKTPDESFFK